MSFRVGIDTGGTFTDAVAVDEKGNLVQAKALTTPEDLKKGIIDCLDGLARKLDLDHTRFLGEISALVHGTAGASQYVTTSPGYR